MPEDGEERFMFRGNGCKSTARATTKRFKVLSSVRMAQFKSKT